MTERTTCVVFFTEDFCSFEKTFFNLELKEFTMNTNKSKKASGSSSENATIKSGDTGENATIKSGDPSGKCTNASDTSQPAAIN